MGQKLSEPDLALYRAVDEVLHYVWDPIGVSAIPEARDEYYGYLPHVFRLVREEADELKIAAYLTSVTTERMRLSPRSEQDLAVARLLLSWEQSIARSNLAFQPTASGGG